jgi:hypothetical protein
MSSFPSLTAHRKKETSSVLHVSTRVTWQLKNTWNIKHRRVIYIYCQHLAHILYNKKRSTWHMWEEALRGHKGTEESLRHQVQSLKRAQLHKRVWSWTCSSLSWVPSFLSSSQNVLQPTMKDCISRIHVMYLHPFLGFRNQTHRTAIPKPSKNFHASFPP